MIVQISGNVIDVGENSVTIEVGDIAHEILVPTSVVNSYRGKLKGREDDGKDVFYTIQYIEGSSGHGNQFMRLVGFKRKIEKDFFQLYTSVEGIGYKTALKSLIFPIQKIALAVEKNDIVVLKKLPHIGTRTAEKMVATLKGRMQKFTLDLENQPLAAHPQSDLHSEVLQVLSQVGYREQESSLLIEKAMEASPGMETSEEVIQEIFKMRNTPEQAIKN